MLSAVEALRVVEGDKSWIPLEFKGKITFFSDYDLWQYNYIHDDVVCPTCEGHGDMAVMIGSVIRLLFPYLEIIGEDTILVNEHPNCRCFLKRIGFYGFTLGKEKKREIL